MNYKKTKINNLYNKALSDWPNQILNNQFFNVLENFVNGELTSENISKKLKNIDYNTEAWQSESLSYLMEVFELDKGEKNLKQIIYKNNEVNN